MLTEIFIEKNFPKGKLTLVGGCPAIGITSFAISLTISLAKLNKKCIYFSVGMEEQQLIERYKRQVNIEEYNAIAGNITVDDTWEDLNTSYMRKQIELYQPDYIIIDYIQVMTCNHPSMDRKTEMQAILRELKTLASDCKISVIEQSQLNRCHNDTSCFLTPNDFRELLLDELEDINPICIHQGEFSRKREYEYDSDST